MCNILVTYLMKIVMCVFYCCDLRKCLVRGNHFVIFFQRFTQYLASNNYSFNLSGFVDKGGAQGRLSFIVLWLINYRNILHIEYVWHIYRTLSFSSVKGMKRKT